MPRHVCRSCIVAPFCLTIQNQHLQQLSGWLTLYKENGSLYYALRISDWKCLSLSQGMVTGLK